jgi:hypothetical protein
VRLEPIALPQKRQKVFGMKSFKWIALISLLWSSASFAQSQPVLLFSDLIWGPKTGWERSSSKGAAVTIWGTNLGTSGSVKACGQTLSSTDPMSVAEWNATANPRVPRGLARITFWLNARMSATCSEGLAATVGGQSSNVLPFTIASGSIYFISASDGNDSYNGLYSTRSGHTGSDGPFRNAYKFDPSNNAAGDGQYIMYIRAGSYSAIDPFDSNAAALIELYGTYGGSSRQKALIGYPAEMPTLDLRNTSYGAVYQNGDTSGPNGGGPNDYFTWSKLYITGANTTHGQDALDIYGQYDRIIGSNIVNMRPSSQHQSGFTFVGASQYGSIYGNYYFNNGYDSYAHNIYIKTQRDGYPDSLPVSRITTQNIDVGWNEFDSPFSNDHHGGVIFLSKGGNNPPASPNDTKNIYIHGNYFHDGTQGDFIYTGDGYQYVDQIYIYDNIFQGGSMGGDLGAVNINAGTRNIAVFNNTFYQAGSGGNYDVWVGGSGDAKVLTKNNIYYSLNNQQILKMESYSGITRTSDHDLFFNPAGAVDYSAFSNIAITNQVSSQNPQFLVQGSDFHLQSSSPAAGAGVNLTSTVASWPSGVLDYLGIMRPGSGAWDIGAIAATGETGVRPAPPSGLAATVQ